MSGMKPQQRSLKNLTDRGYLCASVERRKSFPDSKKRRCLSCGNVPQISISVDLFNCFDIYACHPELRTQVLVQTTSRNNHSTRRNKILASMEAKLCLLSGTQILVQSWRLDEKQNRWRNFDEWLTVDDFKQAPNYPNDVRTLLEIKRKAKRPDLPPGTKIPYEPIKDDSIPF